MRQFLIGFVALFAGFALHATSAEAQWGGSTSGHLTFEVMKSDHPGCVKMNYVSPYNGFPNLDNGVVTMVRFAHSTIDADSVTENSPAIETTLTTDENGSLAVTPNEFCGFKPEHYYFKYALYDANNELLEFMAPGDFDPYSNSVDLSESPSATLR